MMKTLIKDGRIVTESGICAGDILIEGEKIAAVSSNISVPADLLLDAEGKYILPGGVDQHVHFGYDYEGAKVRGFETSAAALAGGTTTIADFVDALPRESRLDALRRYQSEQILGKADCDYVLHINIKAPSENDYREIGFLPEEGVTTINIFISHAAVDAYVRDDEIMKILAAAKEAGVTVFIHAENCDMADYLTERLIKKGKTATVYHKEARPVLIEEESIARICSFSLLTGAPVMITHISSCEGVEVLRSFQKRRAVVFGETCPHYLVLDEDKLGLPDFEGAKYVCNPPLRPRFHQDYLWQVLADGILTCVGTDHCAFNWQKQKKLGLSGHHLIPKGIPGLQDRLSLLWTYGVESGRLSIERLAEIFAENPARVLGIYPQKGVLKAGSDADIVLFDPVKSGVFSNQDSLHGIDYHAYEGMKRTGSVEKVWLRGRLLFDGGRFIGQKGQGRFIPGKPFGLCYKV